MVIKSDGKSVEPVEIVLILPKNIGLIGISNYYWIDKHGKKYDSKLVVSK